MGIQYKNLATVEQAFNQLTEIPWGILGPVTVNEALVQGLTENVKSKHMCVTNGDNLIHTQVVDERPSGLREILGISLGSSNFATSMTFKKQGHNLVSVTTQIAPFAQNSSGLRHDYFRDLTGTCTVLKHTFDVVTVHSPLIPHKKNSTKKEVHDSLTVTTFLRNLSTF